MSEQFKEFARKYGRAKAELGIITAIEDPNREGRRFVPAPSEFIEYIERADPNYRQKFGPIADRGCKVCDDTGFKPIGEGSNRRVTPCDCRKL